jgi:SNF2 family DNA or RNA helicase
MLQKTLRRPRHILRDSRERKVTPELGMGFIVVSSFIDPSAILPPNSELWKSSKVDIRKSSWNKPQQPEPPQQSRPSTSSSNASSTRSSHPSTTTATSYPLSSGPSRQAASPIKIPTQVPRPNPVRAPSSSTFIHPESIRQEYAVDIVPKMSAEDADKAIQTFFESAMTPEKENGKEDGDENAGVVEGLKCTLMKHQIEGLEFLLDHECLDENVKGKGKYGGLLGDDVLSLHLILKSPLSSPYYPTTFPSPSPVGSPSHPFPSS